MLKPVMEKRFWFYNDWTGGWDRGGDEWGHHTVVIPLGKERALVVVWRSGYKGPFKCKYCVEGRQQSLEFEQEMLYVQTYWNVKDINDDEYLTDTVGIYDVYKLSDDQWDEALGVTRKGQ